MKIVETELIDCYIIETSVFGDYRGYFSPFFIKKDFDACMISNNELLAVYNAFDYDYLSESEDIKKINNT